MQEDFNVPNVPGKRNLFATLALCIIVLVVFIFVGVGVNNLITKKDKISLESTPEVLKSSKEILCTFSGEDIGRVTAKGKYCFISKRIAGEIVFVVNDVVTSFPNPEGIMGWSVSPDGLRYAFPTSKWVFLDGKKIDFPYRGYSEFSPDSKHFTFTTPNSIVFDGVESKKYNGGVYYPIFSGDSKRFAYTALENNDKDRVNFYRAVVDGKEEKLYGGYTYDEPSGPFYVTFSPDSKHYGYVAETKVGNIKQDIVVIDGKEIATHEYAGGLRFSDDGNSFGYNIRKGGKYALVVGGIEQELFDAISQWQFLPQSHEVIYKARNGGKEFLVTKNVQGRSHSMIVSFGVSTDGKSVYYVSDDGGKSQLFLNGKEVTDLVARKPFCEYMSCEGVLGIQHVTFSPDGTKLAYSLYDSKEDTFFPVINGEKQKFGLRFYSAFLEKLVFSPDGNHFIYYSEDQIILDSLVNRKFDHVWNVEFSKDGEFLIYTVTEGNSVNRYVQAWEDFSMRPFENQGVAQKSEDGITYYDEVYGYSFKYPNNWYVSEKNPSNGELRLRQSGDTNEENILVIDTNVQPSDIPEGSSFLDSFKHYTLYENSGMGPAGKITQFTVDSHSALMVEHAPAVLGQMGYFVELNSGHFFYIYSFGSFGTVYADEIKELVSSIKFSK